jgi:hypothetical protein
MRTKKSLKLTVLASALALACAALAFAQTGADRPARVGAGAPYDEQVKALLARPEMQAAFADVDKNRDAILKEWIALTEINAPSGKEAERAATSRSRCDATPPATSSPRAAARAAALRSSLTRTWTRSFRRG